MSSSLRQSELFAGNDWRVLYQAFTNINFNASDPPTINLALRQFIQQNYPEDFNDWIESSEFVALIDLLSWVAGTLAFRTDINARENFLDTAEARESVLRLARFLSYTAHRNQAARGLVKLVAVQTNDDVIDGFGNNLNNQTIQWNDPDNPDWFEQFTLILNNGFIATNPFGIPLKSGLVGGIKTQLYRVNNTIGNLGTYPFTSFVSNSTMDFEAVNIDFDVGGGFNEQMPDPETAFHMVYRNDGNGNVSANTGFFLLFKQGSLGQQVFVLKNPIENQVLDINQDNINNTDVWVQTVDDNGLVLQDWTQVPVLITDNITFTSVPATVRNIFQVITRDDDQISLRFSDGRFGAVPTGNLRVWYRTSNGLQYQIRPQDINRVQVTIPYVNARGVSKNLLLTFSLQASVTNSVARETTAQIQRRAPQVYATQNRMVSGEDYNVFPLQGNLAVKLKAINRVYSGHSRYIDLNDPTGTYQNTNVFADDGLLYRESNNAFDEVPLSLNMTSEQIVEDIIQPRLSVSQTASFMLDSLRATYSQVPSSPVYWYQSEVAKFSSTGIFVSAATGQPTPPVPIGNLLSSTTIGHYLDEGSLVRFADFGWAAIASLDGNGTTISPSGQGSVQLSGTVPQNALVEKVIPALRTTLTADERSAIQTRLDNHFSFNLQYDPVAVDWVLSDLNVPISNTILVLTAEYIAGVWRIRTSGLRYVFESEQNVRWFFDPQFSAINQQTGLAAHDVIRVLSINTQPGASTPLGKTYDLALDRLYVYADGSTEPRRVQVVFADEDLNGIPDDPETFVNIVSSTSPQNLLFWQRYIGTDNEEYYQPIDGVVAFADSTIRGITNGVANQVYYQLSDNTFWLWNVITASWTAATAGDYRTATGRGGNSLAMLIDGGGSHAFTPAPLSFQWKHFAPNDHRIDPASTNFIDIFVLDTTYDTLVRQWIANGADPSIIPVPPTQIELAIMFAQFEQFKMFSDEIVWRPVQYKFLFGNGALPELRAQFKVVVLPTTTLSNGEIQSQVIRMINTFFASNNWDFGETFYFTELSAFVHQQLATAISSFVIVPTSADASFGDLFEVACGSDEVFISTAQVADVVIISANTAANLRIQ